MREVEQALLALPEPRLIAGHLIETFELGGWAPPPQPLPGDVCVVGAYCAWKMGEGDIRRGKESLLRQELRSLQDELEYGEDAPDLEETANAGVNAGLRFTMAWELSFFNDETCGRETPEQRYDRTLAYVRSLL